MLAGMRKLNEFDQVQPVADAAGGAHMRPYHDVDQVRPGVAAWVLWPLRLFLGVTFVDAGVGKLLAPAWFGVGPQSFAAQTRGFVAASPIGGLLRVLVLPHPLPFAFLIAVG